MSNRDCKIHNCYYHTISEKHEVESEYLCPIDKKGYCLFHSKDKEWKLENKFLDNFNELLAIINNLIKNGVKHIDYDFRNFVFIGEYYVNNKTGTLDYNPKLKGITYGQFNIIPEMPTIIIKDFTFNGNVSFTGATFESFIIFSDVHFNEYATFAGSIFNDHLVIKDCYFKGVSNFSKCTFKETLYFDNAEVTDYMKFNESEFHCGLDFFESNFFGQIDFSNSVIKETVKDFTSVFSKTNFDSFIFNEVKVECGLDFLEVKFNGQCEFTNTSFSKNYHTNFYNIIVKGTVIFRGNGTENIFNHRVSFSFFEDKLRGNIIFENVNISHIDKADKDLLLSFERENKVSIGKGCIKYRVKTSTVKIEVSTINHNLIKELSTAFTNYFIHSNGFNLGVEFINKTLNSLELYYFTDENITIEEFNKRLKITRKSFFNLSKDAGILRNNDIGQIDNIISKTSVLTKIKYRKDLGKWSDFEMEQLQKAISICRDEKLLGNINFYFNNLNTYMKIKKIEAEKGSNVVIAENIKRLNFKINNSIDDKDLEKIKNLFSQLDSSEINYLKTKIEKIDNSAEKKKNGKLNKFKDNMLDLFIKHGIPIGHSVSSNALFEVIKQFVF